MKKNIRFNSSRIFNRDLFKHLRAGYAAAGRGRQRFTRHGC
ncbi:MAG TPA: hypothetical protein VNI84_03240 [Pyrinomonadaceae bacterium]|nr:hypothetical protein [Pyrinomonadaceae bacterium]